MALKEEEKKQQKSTKVKYAKPVYKKPTEKVQKLLDIVDSKKKVQQKMEKRKAVEKSSKDRKYELLVPTFLQREFLLSQVQMLSRYSLYVLMLIILQYPKMHVDDSAIRDDGGCSEDEAHIN